MIELRPERSLRTYAKYTQIFNSMGMIEVGGALLCKVLGIIAIACAPSFFTVPILTWAGSLVLLATGIVGILTRPKSSYEWIICNVGTSYFSLILQVAGCAVILNQSTSLAMDSMQNNIDIKDGVIASYVVVAFLQILLALVTSIHAGYATASLVKSSR